MLASMSLAGFKLVHAPNMTTLLALRSISYTSISSIQTVYKFKSKPADLTHCDWNSLKQAAALADCDWLHIKVAHRAYTSGTVRLIQENITQSLHLSALVNEKPGIILGYPNLWLYQPCTSTKSGSCAHTLLLLPFRRHCLLVNRLARILIADTASLEGISVSWLTCKRGALVYTIDMDANLRLLCQASSAEDVHAFSHTLSKPVHRPGIRMIKKHSVRLISHRWTVLQKRLIV